MVLWNCRGRNINQEKLYLEKTESVFYTTQHRDFVSTMPDFDFNLAHTDVQIIYVTDLSTMFGLYNWDHSDVKNSAAVKCEQQGR